MTDHKAWTTLELKIVEIRRGSGIYGRSGWRESCCKVLGRTPASISYGAKLIGKRSNRPRRDYKSWTTADERELLLMASKGISWRNIGLVMDRTADACRRRAYKLKDQK